MKIFEGVHPIKVKTTAYLPLVLVLVINGVMLAPIIFGIQVLEIQQLQFSFYLTLFVLLLFLFVIYKAYKYRRLESTGSDSDSNASISVIVPVYNEERLIKPVILRVIEALNHFDQKEIIVINDGSVDQSSEVLNGLLNKFPSELRIFHFTKNRGKKEALVFGFKKAKYDFVLTIDSDTLIDPASISELMKVSNGASAVCGYTRVSNKSATLLTRIQSFEYFISHELFKAFEAQYNGVLCCPGCFTMYRRDDVLTVLNEFTLSMIGPFPVDYGEDRYLTALLLKIDKQIVYQPHAIAHTEVPDTLRSFIIQRHRWIKSWFINSIFLFRTVIKKNVFYQFYFFLSFLFNILITIAPISLIVLALNGHWILFINILLVVGVYVLFGFIIQKKSMLFVSIGFFLLTIGIYSWLLPYAVSKLHDPRWGLRSNAGK